MALPFIEPARRNLAYLFLAAGIAWLAVLFATLSFLIVWPTVVLLVSGVLLKMWPEARFSGAWVTSSAILGFVLSAYQTYAAASHLTGALAYIAPLSLVLFLLFALYHLFLVYAGNTSEEEKEKQQ
jgi:hypothetical protein